MLLGITRTILVYAKPWFSWFGGSGSAAEQNLGLPSNATPPSQNLSRGFRSFQKTWLLALSIHLQVRRPNTLLRRTVPRVQVTALVQKTCRRSMFSLHLANVPNNPNLRKRAQKSCCLEITRNTSVYAKPLVSAGTLPTGQVKISI